jgi:hypothetical protein
VTQSATPTETFIEPTLEPLVVPLLDLRKAFTSQCGPGRTANMQLSVRNIGDGATSGPTVITDPMPVGMTLQLPVTAMGWDCSQSTPTLLSCSYAGVIGIGQAAPSIVAKVQVAANAKAALLNTASAETAGTLEPVTASASTMCVLAAPAPALSPLGLGLGIATLLGAAAVAFRRRR